MSNTEEIEKLKEEIEILKKGEAILKTWGVHTTSHYETLGKMKTRLAALTRPAIKDDVLGRAYKGIMTFWQYRINYEDGTFHPLTIEELLATLAQWVPGAVRWEYARHDRIILLDSDNGYYGSIPAPPRDDWETVGGEL